MKNILPLLLCFSLSAFAAARTTKAAHTPARHVRSVQNNLRAQKANTRPLLSDETNDQDVSSDDEDNIAGGSDNQGEEVNDENGSDAGADQDTGAAGNDDGSDESPDDGGK
jgi:hypothetical protein